MDRQEWFTATEAAELLRVNRSTIYRMAGMGQLPYHVLPSGVGRRFHRNDLEAALGEARVINQPTEGERWNSTHSNRSPMSSRDLVR